MSKISDTLHNIQVLRAIAAILVVLHHAFPHYQAMGTPLPWIEHISNWGFMGVDIFFVISGFIMAYTTFDKPRGIKSAKTFFKHRLLRIYLGYLPFFFAMLLVIKHYNPQKLDTLDLVGSFSLLNPNMYQLILPSSWSLTFELYFYLLFLITFLFRKKQLYKVVPLFIVGLFTLVLFSSYSSFMAVSFFYSSFLLEFFLGVLLYMYRDYFMSTGVLIFAIILMLITFYYGVQYETKNGLLRILTFGTGSFLLVLSMLILEHKNMYKGSRLLEPLGNASYTLYLSHLIFLELFYFTGIREKFESTGIFLPLLGFLFIIVTTILFSLLYYHFIEKPLYKRAITRKKV